MVDNSPASYIFHPDNAVSLLCVNRAMTRLRERQREIKRDRERERKRQTERARERE